jgi:hypothetical protein
MFGTIVDHVRAFAAFDGMTLLFYGLMMAFSTLSCVKYDHDKAKGKDSYYWIIIGFVFVWFLLGASRVSGDYPNYVNIFKNSLSGDDWMEKLFMVLNRLVRYFTDSFEVFNFIRAGIFISLVCVFLLLFRKEVFTSIFMLCFTGVYALESQNFMRTYLSASICFVALYFLFNRKLISYCVLITVAFFIHRGTIVMIIPLIYYVFVVIFPERKNWHYVLVSAVSLLLLFLIVFFRRYIFSRSWFPKTYYGVNEEGKLGIACFVYHLPIVVLFVLSLFEDFVDQKWRDFSFVGMLCSFCHDVVSYYTLGIGRMWAYFFPVFGLCASHFLYIGIRKSKWRKWYIVGLVAYVLFILMRILIQTEYFIPYGIMPYETVFQA